MQLSMLFKLTNGVILMNKLQTLMKEYNKVNARVGTDKEQTQDLDTIKEYQTEILPDTLNDIVESQAKSAQIINFNVKIIEQHFDGSDDITDEEYFLAVNSLDTELDKLGLSTELVSNLVYAAVATTLGELQLAHQTEKSN